MRALHPRAGTKPGFNSAVSLRHWAVQLRRWMRCAGQVFATQQRLALLARIAHSRQADALTPRELCKSQKDR